jgi:hypothetical protein
LRAVSVRPFAEQGHYTAVHDAVFDVVMPRTPPNAFKVLLFVLRKTRGWKKEADVLRYAEIKAGTGIKSDATLAKELAWLLEKRLLIARDEDGREHVKGSRKAPAYSLNKGFELNGVPSETKAPDSPSTLENEAPTTLETKASNKQRNKNQSPNGGASAPTPPKKKNWFAFYCDLAKSLRVIVTPEDRRGDLSANLKALVEKHGATEEEMYKVVSKLLEAKCNGYEMSPQKALGKVRGNNVTPIRPGAEAETKRRKMVEL